MLIISFIIHFLSYCFNILYFDIFKKLRIHLIGFSERISDYILKKRIFYIVFLIIY